MERVDKLWGYELILVNRPELGPKGYCGKILTVLPNGNACSIHYHREKHETFYVLRGLLAVESYHLTAEGQRLNALGTTPLTLEHFLRTNYRCYHPGEQITFDPLVAHRFWAADGEVAEFIEFSSPDHAKDSYRLVPAGPVPR